MWNSPVEAGTFLTADIFFFSCCERNTEDHFRQYSFSLTEKHSTFQSVHAAPHKSFKISWTFSVCHITTTNIYEMCSNFFFMTEQHIWKVWHAFLYWAARVHSSVCEGSCILKGLFSNACHTFQRFIGNKCWKPTVLQHVYQTVLNFGLGQ